MVCHIGEQLGTKVVISTLRMLALYMCFNGTGIWGDETPLGPKINKSASYTKLKVIICGIILCYMADEVVVFCIKLTA